MSRYAFPPGGLPDQRKNPAAAGAVFTTSFAFIPADTMRDITTSQLPHWTQTRAWILARPLTGFAETFSQYAVEVAPRGGSQSPDTNPLAQSVVFVASGEMTLSLDGVTHVLEAGGYAYIPAGHIWTVRNKGSDVLQFHWLRKRYQPVAGIAAPAPFVTSDQTTAPNPMSNTDLWATTRFVEPDDLRHDMHVNIVTFQPGGRIPFAETHVMEHGLYVLEGTARYLLNDQWVGVGPGDFMWLRAFCPQACIATGDGPFRYLLYKDVNRHAELAL
ncbi:bifunctional allantoicase/(S)-ureidoglycine aminohydrolase [Algirhabdus cladophorae]|uniref:bifunctional allantoicase/(S)-ureidoglycine aminohydrolase n=1 Tax=Algirhabdus cladophorae TaxID=3377108 RepID=UPI003B84A449